MFRSVPLESVLRATISVCLRHGLLRYFPLWILHCGGKTMAAQGMKPLACTCSERSKGSGSLLQSPVLWINPTIWIAYAICTRPWANKSIAAWKGNITCLAYVVVINTWSYHFWIFHDIYKFSCNWVGGYFEKLPWNALIVRKSNHRLFVSSNFIIR